MGFFEKIREFILKLQALPEQKKKVIFFTVIAIAALIMIFFEIKSTKNNISKIGESLKLIDLPTAETSDKLSRSDMEKDPVSSNTSRNESQNQNSDWPAINAPGVADADWKTYKNDAYGFEVKYPANMSVEENSSDVNFIYARFQDNGLYPFWVSSGNSKQKNIIEMTSLKSSDYAEIKSKKLTINHINWNTIEEVSISQESVDILSSVINFYTQKGDSVYVLQCVNCNTDLFGDSGMNKKLVFNQMLYTFKFTE